MKNNLLYANCYLLSKNGQIVIFLVFLLAVLLAFMGGIISVGNKSLRNLRMQNAADAAALAGAACLARGLNSMANLTASKFNPSETEPDKKSLVYPFYPNNDKDAVSPYLKIELKPKQLPEGESVKDIHEYKELYFDALPNYGCNKVINEGENDYENAANLQENNVKRRLRDHLSLIKNAIDETEKEYVGGGDFNSKISNMAKKFALENGYSAEIGSAGETWEPEWKRELDIDIRYSYWLEHKKAGITIAGIKVDCAGNNCCKPCNCNNPGFLPLLELFVCFECEICYEKKEIVEPLREPFWVEGYPQSTMIETFIRLAEGQERTAVGEVRNICPPKNEINKDCGQLFPPQANFKIQLSD